MQSLSKKDLGSYTIYMQDEEIICHTPLPTTISNSGTIPPHRLPRLPNQLPLRPGLEINPTLSLLCKECHTQPQSTNKTKH